MSPGVPGESSLTPPNSGAAGIKARGPQRGSSGPPAAVRSAAAGCWEICPLQRICWRADHVTPGVAPHAERNPPPGPKRTTLVGRSRTSASWGRALDCSGRPRAGRRRVADGLTSSRSFAAGSLLRERRRVRGHGRQVGGRAELRSGAPPRRPNTNRSSSELMPGDCRRARRRTPSAGKATGHRNVDLLRCCVNITRSFSLNQRERRVIFCPMVIPELIDIQIISNRTRNDIPAAPPVHGQVRPAADIIDAHMRIPGCPLLDRAIDRGAGPAQACRRRKHGPSRGLEFTTQRMRSPRSPPTPS